MFGLTRDPTDDSFSSSRRRSRLLQLGPRTDTDRRVIYQTIRDHAGSSLPSKRSQRSNQTDRHFTNDREQRATSVRKKRRPFLLDGRRRRQDGKKEGKKEVSSTILPDANPRAVSFPFLFAPQQPGSQPSKIRTRESSSSSSPKQRIPSYCQRDAPWIEHASILPPTTKKRKTRDEIKKENNNNNKNNNKNNKETKTMNGKSDARSSPATLEDDGVDEEKKTGGLSEKDLQPGTREFELLSGVVYRRSPYCRERGRRVASDVPTIAPSLVNVNSVEPHPP
ncbi:hypothetical protein K0M31_014455 [Melipona bicolor]|uniref:Uncharacterized protein n=1 Tax=Melipona bicolor TaxID=60889 RepID=A0AA40KUB0_9HYME|nr:hypothetical protein K0M31_014455 [Melipona bicolor]